MKCSEIRELLSAYANDELDGVQKDFVEEHLAVCRDCQATLADYRVIKQQLAGLSTPSLRDIREETMSRIKTRAARTGTIMGRWLVTAVFAVLIIAALTSIPMLRNWNAGSGSQGILAKAYSATEAVRSYRSTSSPFITFPLSSPDNSGVRNVGLDAEWEFVLPDKIHLKVQFNGSEDEYYFIGNSIYYRDTNTITFAQGSFLPISVPSKEVTIAELKKLNSSTRLPDEVIDGVDCYHYEGTYQQDKMTVRVEYWIGKDNYLIRQVKRTDDYGTSATKYYDFNAPINIEAPVGENGKPLPGWLVVSDNYSSSLNSSLFPQTNTTESNNDNPTTKTLNIK